MRITLIGAGRVATHFGRALCATGCQIEQVYSRTLVHAQCLAHELRAEAIDEASQLQPGADIYLFCLADAALRQVSSECLKALLEKSADCQPLFVHTAGSMPLEVLPSERRGVAWPMQTFSLDRAIDWRQVHVFVESLSDESLLRDLLHCLTPHVHFVSAYQRGQLHLASVFACNFSNHMYTLAARILQQADLPFEALLPLVDETVRKVHQLPPHEAQTGPAVRGDENVLQKHMAMLQSDELLQNVYQIISKSIRDDQLRSQKN